MKSKILQILNEFKAPYDSDGVYVNAINEDDFPAIAEKIEALDNWVSVEIKPEHNQQCLCYTPESDINEEQYRLIRFGTQLSGFPIGVTHYQPLPSKPKTI